MCVQYIIHVTPQVSARGVLGCYIGVSTGVNVELVFVHKNDDVKIPLPLEDKLFVCDVALTPKSKVLMLLDFLHRNQRSRSSTDHRRWW